MNTCGQLEFQKYIRNLLLVVYDLGPDCLPMPPPPPPKKKKDVICAYGLVIRYDLHNYGKTTYGQIFHTIMSWLMTACVRSPVCLACAWILVQACQASVGTDVDGKSCFIDATL